MKSTMTAIFLPFAAALAACTPSPQESALHSSSRDPGTTADASDDQKQAAVGPAPESVSAAENPMPPAPNDSPAEAQGRRTLSTAFVQVGPDGHLTVGLRNGRVLVLRNVIMRAQDYCGVQVSGGKAGGKYCGGYAEVAAAKPGGGPVPVQPDLAAPNPLGSSTAKPN